MLNKEEIANISTIYRIFTTHSWLLSPPLQHNNSLSPHTHITFYLSLYLSLYLTIYCMFIHSQFTSLKHYTVSLSLLICLSIVQSLAFSLTHFVLFIVISLPSLYSITNTPNLICSQLSSLTSSDQLKQATRTTLSYINRTLL